jgi:outer membrane protein OmpA-like peptidoglycan-associated protein
MEIEFNPLKKGLFGFSFFFIMPCFFIFGQTKKCLVQGEVTHYKTRQRIESKLVFEKQPEAALTVISQSGTRGYRANLFDRGEYLCVVSAEGFVSEQCLFNLESDSLASREILVRNFQLIPIALNEVLPFEKILFDVTSYKLSNSSLPELSRLYSMLSENSGIKIQLEGHTDNYGKSRKSIKLAKNRIQEVKNWLVKKGIEKNRIKLKAFGGEKPVNGLGSPDARKVNRRVEVRVLGL